MIDIYQIDNLIRDVLAQNTNDDGELSEEAFAELEKLHELKERLPEEIALCLKNEMAEANAYKAEEEALAKRRKTVEARCSKYKEWLAANIEKSFKTSKVAVRITPTTKCVVINADMLPDEYWRTKREANVSKAKTALLKGEEVPGAALVTGKSASVK